jgi:hypothetical protein
MRRALLLPLATVVAAALVACGADPAPTPAGESSPSASASPTPTEVVFEGDLRTLLVAPPEGAAPTTVDEAPDGSMNIDQAAMVWSSQNPDAAKGILEYQKFQAGAVVKWLEGAFAGRVMLLQFEEGFRARNWLRDRTSAVERFPGYASGDELATIPEGQIHVVNLESGQSAYVLFRKGAIAVDILAVSTSTVDIDALTAFAEQQYALLP